MWEFDRQDEFNALNELAQYNYNYQEELGSAVPRFNGAQRVDIFRNQKKAVINSPFKLLTIFNKLNQEKHQLSYGLKMNNHLVHFIIEEELERIGVYFLDHKKEVNIRKVISIEKAMTKMGLNKSIIITNNFSIPALKLIDRINFLEEKIKIHYLNSLEGKEII